jgi:hypothetical protein
MIGIVLLDKNKETSEVLGFWEMSLDFKNQSAQETENHKEHVSNTEFCTKAELDNLRNNKLELVFQALLKRDKIVRKHPYLSQLVEFSLFRILNFSSHKRSPYVFDKYLVVNFERLSELWLASLRLQLRVLSPLSSVFIENLYDFVQYLNYVVCNKFPFLIELRRKHFDLLLHTFKFCLFSIQRALDSFKELSRLFKNTATNPDYFKFITFDKTFGGDDDFSSLVITKTDLFHLKDSRLHMCHLIKFSVYLLRLIFSESDLFGLQIDYSKLNVLVESLIKFSDESNFAVRVLALSMRDNLLSDCIYGKNNLTHFDSMNEKCIEYLLKRGASPDTSICQNSKNTCFNFCLFQLNNHKFTIDALDRILLLFLKHGAHFDSRNEQNLTVKDQYYAKFNEKLPSFLENFYSKVNSLQCLCANVIVKSKLDYSQHLSRHLVSFVKKH